MCSFLLCINAWDSYDKSWGTQFNDINAKTPCPLTISLPRQAQMKSTEKNTCPFKLRNCFSSIYYFTWVCIQIMLLTDTIHVGIYFPLTSAKCIANRHLLSFWDCLLKTFLLMNLYMLAWALASVHLFLCRRVWFHTCIAACFRFYTHFCLMWYRNNIAMLRATGWVSISFFCLLEREVHTQVEHHLISTSFPLLACSADRKLGTRLISNIQVC